jgi:hypothetical protein
MAETTNCPVHGSQQQTFVCQHIVEGLRAEKRVGFWWATDDPSNPRPDACCTACNERVKLTDGEWTDEILEIAKPQLLCGACYDSAKQFHMGGTLGSDPH